MEDEYEQKMTIRQEVSAFSVKSQQHHIFQSRNPDYLHPAFIIRRHIMLALFCFVIAEHLPLSDRHIRLGL